MRLTNFHIKVKDRFDTIYNDQLPTLQILFTLSPKGLTTLKHVYLVKKSSYMYIENFFRTQYGISQCFDTTLSHSKTHSKGIMVISYLKLPYSKYKRLKQSSCNQKVTNYQIPIQSNKTYYNPQTYFFFFIKKKPNM